MPLQCPHCALPMTEKDAATGACPGCGISFTANAEKLDAAPTPVAVIASITAETSALPATRRMDQNASPSLAEEMSALALAPVPVESSGGDWIFRGVVLLFLAFVGGVFYLQYALPKQPAKAVRRGAESQHLVQAEVLTPAASTKVTEIKPEPATVAIAQVSPAAPVVAPPATPASPVVLVRAAVDPLIELAGDVQRIDHPEARYVVPELHGHARVQLIGRVQTLEVGDIDGASTLDASQLEAREIVVRGRIAGRSHVKLWSPGGKVVFQAPLGEGSEVTVMAPCGEVFTATASGGLGGTIGDGAQVHILAKTVELDAPIDGGAQVLVTLSAAGKLRFAKLLGTSQLTWRKSASDEPQPTLQAGETAPTAAFVRQ